MATNGSSEATVTTQTQAPLLPLADQNQSFPFFHRLPTELRQLVWFFTFSPRIVQIQLHSKVVPHNPKQLAVVHFTATEDLLKISSAQWQRFSSLETRSDTLQSSSEQAPSPALSGRYPRGPTALYVCRESRKVALMHYELAFGGVELYEDIVYSRAWREGGFAEKKIWVNFKIDQIAILANDLADPAYRKIGRNNEVYELTQCAKIETSKIQRLAVSESWNPPSHPAGGGHLPSFTLPRRYESREYTANSSRYFDHYIDPHKNPATSHLKKLLKDFNSIKELEVYEIGDWPPQICPVSKRMVESKFREQDLGPWKENLLHELEREKENTPEWTADLPKITVRKGWRRSSDGWDGTFLP